ncbi:MAG: histidinol dehydrogenase, partial [Bacteroidaceae bacterium]|nr:histidinol dehydrogenase [Bacteroidaceae bacterium]
MNIIKYPSKLEWGALLERPHRDASELRETVLTVLDQIRKDGDSAVKAFEEKFDKVQLDGLAVSDEEMAEAEALVSDDLKEALVFAHANIE